MIKIEDLYVYSGSKMRTENKCLADKITSHIPRLKITWFGWKTTVGKLAHR